MHAPIRPVRDAGWPDVLQRRFGRFFWTDPRVVTAAPSAADPAGFARSMAAFHVGGTIKITGPGRHRAGDGLLLRHVPLADAHLVDIGASDGTTSLELIEALPAFRRFTLADRYVRVRVRTVGRRTVFSTPDEEPIVVAGPRLLAWPGQSPGVRALYAPVLRRAGSAPYQDVLLLNPAVRARIAADPRVDVVEHDVFRPWPGPVPDVIKVANLLRRLYFPDARIATALRLLLEGLPEGGHLLVVDNPRIAGIAERAGLYRRVDARFELVDRTEHAPEIGELVLGARPAG